MDGPSTLQALRELPMLAHVLIVFGTAEVQPAEIVHFKSLGALEVIPEPFNPIQPPTRLREIWGGR